MTSDASIFSWAGSFPAVETFRIAMTPKDAGIRNSLAEIDFSRRHFSGSPFREIFSPVRPFICDPADKNALQSDPAILPSNKSEALYLIRFFRRRFFDFTLRELFSPS
jgi:hypothetical protein